jgi:hypothetical protein
METTNVISTGWGAPRSSPLIFILLNFNRPYQHRLKVINMDDNPFANPFADDADTSNPFAALPSGVPSGSGIQSPGIASYTSGFDSSSRRASIASTGDHHAYLATGEPQPEPEESPYLRKLEQDGVISGITSPAAAFQSNPFSQTAPTRNAGNDDTDAFKGGFYSPPAFNTADPPIPQHQNFQLSPPATNRQSSFDAAHTPQRTPGAQTTHQDNLEALGLAPLADPTADLKAAFIKHPARPSESTAPTTADEVKDAPSDAASKSEGKPAAVRPSGGVSAGARRRKKVMGISVDNVERERERERERLERERVEREAARKEREERERVERERREKEGPKEETRESEKVEEAKDSVEESSDAPTETQPVISSTTAEQILLSSDPHQTSQAIAQQLDSADDLSGLPPLPASEGNTRTGTPEPVPDPASSSGTAPHPHSQHGHAHSGLVRSHLDPVVTSPLDGTNTDGSEPNFHALSLGASATSPSREDASHGRTSWGRAFEEEDTQHAVKTPLDAPEGPVSAAWTTDLPTGTSDRGGVWTSPGGVQGDGWGGSAGGLSRVCYSLSRVHTWLILFEIVT